MATWGHLMLLESNSSTMEEMIFFHDYTLTFMLGIIMFVAWLLFNMIINKLNTKFIMMSHKIEIAWTTIPALILILIAFPSIKLLYLMDEMDNPSISIKVIGNQWFWTYEYSDYENINSFDSYLIPTNKLMNEEFRLLDVDHRLIIPTNTQIRLIITALDVLHSWTIPSLGIKLDATPGRLNQMQIHARRSGLYYGQCSEICGVNHSFMPIVIESIPVNNFMNYMHKLLI